MIKILEKQIKMTQEQVEELYPNTKYIFGLEAIDSDIGYLHAISDNSEDFKKLCDECKRINKESESNLTYGVFGSYNNGGALYVLYKVEEQ